VSSAEEEKKRKKGWFFRKTYGDEPWHGPYSS
jgi:hypothetical protein